MNNFDRHFGDPSKLANCIIENDIEAELRDGNEDSIHVYSTHDECLMEIGRFAGPWEFEEWLYSDLSYDEWKQQRLLEK